ncbi:MAG: TlpA disulfide reductase family protein [Planctomycetota bacterium]
MITSTDTRLLQSSLSQPSTTSRKTSGFLGGYFPFVAALSVVVAIFLVVLNRDLPDLAPPSSHPAVGTIAPRTELIRLDDLDLNSSDSIRLQSLEWEGKVSLVHLWGTWCGPCRMEYPELAEMVSSFERNNEFQFVSVSCEGGPGESVEGLQGQTLQFLDGIETSDDLAVYADPRGVTRRSLLDRLDQRSLYFPTSVLVDAEGKIAGVWEGYKPEGVEQMKELIESTMD